MLAWQLRPEKMDSVQLQPTTTSKVSSTHQPTPSQEKKTAQDSQPTTLWSVASPESKAPDIPSYTRKVAGAVLMDVSKLHAKEWQVGDEMSFLIPQTGYVVNARLEEVQEHVGGITTLKSYPDETLANHVLVTLGRENTFVNVFTPEGEYELVGNLEKGWLMPSQALGPTKTSHTEAELSADLSILCPCSVESVGLTAVKVTAGIKNRGEGASGDLRILLSSSAAVPIGPRFRRASFYLTDSLQAKASIESLSRTAGFRTPFFSYEFDQWGFATLVLRLQESVDGVWKTRDDTRLDPRLYFLDLQTGGGSATYSLHIEGKPELIVNGNQATVRIPKLVNSSSESVQIDEIQIGHFRSETYWSSTRVIALTDKQLGLDIPAFSSIENIEIQGDYTQPASHRPFTHLALIRDGDTQLWQTIAARDGYEIPTRNLSVSSIDFLADTDNDLVSDYNESLMDTDPNDASSTPGELTLDVMVLYTPGVVDIYAGEPLARIIQELEWGNQSLVNSEINAQLRLVDARQVLYSEDQSTRVAFGDARGQLGVFENIDALREEVGADLLALYIEGATDGFCGWGTVPAVKDDGDLAFTERSDVVSVVVADCRTRTLTHEFGHNTGLGHSVRDSFNQGTFWWSRGHGSDGNFKTIMAESDYRENRPDIQFFSNPEINCFGEPCGVDRSDEEFGADAALSIRTTMYQISQLAGPPPDSDGDGIINFEDPDDDNDGFLDEEEILLGSDPTIYDEDSDDDQYPDSVDAFPQDPSEQIDSDSDGIGNNADTDDDNDGLPDSFEVGGLDPFDPTDANLDADSDGATNLEEFTWNTDPNDPLSIDACYDDNALVKTAEGSTLPLETRLYVANPGSNSNQQTFLRFVNTNNAATNIEVYGIDDAGNPSSKGAFTFTLKPGASVQINAQDVENGNSNKGIEANLCDGHGKWQFRVRSNNPIEVIGLIRTPDGFLTSLNDVVPRIGNDNLAYFVNPASNTNQQTFLRVVNLSDQSGSVSVTGVDDSGTPSSGSLSFSLGPFEAKQMTAQDLENGNSNKGLSGSLNNGSGKWRLTLTSSLDLRVMSLIRTPDGFLTNLSGVVASNGDGDHVIYFANPASEPLQTTFLRIVNPTETLATVTISGVDQTGQLAPSGNVQFELSPGAAKQMTGADLERGNVNKGLSGMLGDGAGRWKLTVAANAPVEVMSLIRTPDGFLTNLSRTTPVISGVNEVLIFNPGSNVNQRSSLWISNDSDIDGTVTIKGTDDAGTPAPGGEVTLSIGANSAIEVTASDLESGASHLTGSLGDGAGKWRLEVTSDVDIKVQSLLDTPTGFLTNLSRPAE